MTKTCCTEQCIRCMLTVCMLTVCSEIRFKTIVRLVLSILAPAIRGC